MNQQMVLIVDDDPDSCFMLSTLLNKRGYKTQICHNGPDALRWIERGKPDLAIIDVMMPFMDGWETCERIRLKYDVPVIFIAAFADAQAADRAMKMGNADFVKKPYRNDELLARINALLNRPRRPIAISPITQPLTASPAVQPMTTQSVTWGTLLNQRPMVSVILPTLNEAENLPLVLPYFPLNWVDELILVDGLSSDGTVEIAQKLLPWIKIITEKKPGKGAALQAGYEAASGDILIVLDCDGSHDPREIPRYVAALMEGADFVKGSRFAPGGGTTDMPRYRQFGNGVFVNMVNLLFRATFTDLCYGYHAFWKYCLNWLKLPHADGFEIDTVLYVEALRQQLRITEVSSFEGYRFYGDGKLKTIPDGMRVLSSILREWVNNLRLSSNNVYKGFRGKPPELIQPPVHALRFDKTRLSGTKFNPLNLVHKQHD